MAWASPSRSAISRSSLVEATLFLRPILSFVPVAAARIRALWEGVGMRVDEMDAARHDQVLAWVSHLPHALAFSAVNAVLDVDAAMPQFAGPSFGDLTRVAASSTDMWCDIFLANAAQVDQAVARVLTTLEALRGAIASGDEAAVRALLERARAAQRDWSAARP